MNVLPFLILAIWPFPSAPKCNTPGVVCATFAHKMSSARFHLRAPAIAVYRSGKRLKAADWWMERHGDQQSVVVRVDKLDTVAEEFRIVHR